MPDLFAVIADGTRRAILQALLDRSVSAGVAPAPVDVVAVMSADEMSVGELVVTLGLSQPTVSKHLRVLRDSNLVRVRERGQHRYYRLDPAPLEAVEGWLVPFLGSTDVASPPDLAPTAAGRVVGRAVAEALFRARTVITRVAAMSQSGGRSIAR